MHRGVVLACLVVLATGLQGEISASVEFDGMTWYDSHSPGTVFINSQGHLQWTPYNDHQIIVRIPEQRLSEPGDLVEIVYYWLSDGQGNIAGCEDCFSQTCNYNKDITCVSGTGDFRVGLFESDGDYITADGMGVSNNIFRGYKGYKFCMQPHVDQEVVRWVDPSGEPHIAGGFYERDMIDEPNLLSINSVFDRISMYGSFSLPLGEFSLWILRLERLSETSVRMSIRLNGITYTDIDTTNSAPAYQPSKIDVLAIEFPNPNPYTRIVLARPSDLCPADLNLDGIVNGRDLGVLISEWLKGGSNYLGQTEPNANCLVLHYSFDGPLGTDVPDSLPDATGTYVGTIIPGSDPDSKIIYGPGSILHSVGTSADFRNDNWDTNAGDTFLIPNHSGIDFSSFDEFTLELFVNPTSAGSEQNRRLFSEYVNVFMYLDTGNTLHAYRKWGTGSDWDSCTTHLMFAGLPLDVWSHVALMWDADADGDRFRLYVDGSLADSAPGTSVPTLDSTAGFAIGGYQRESGSTAQFFSGRIDEFKLYSYALSEDEIVFAATAGQGIITYYKSPANLYDDEKVTFRDFAVFAGYWLQTCP